MAKKIKEKTLPNFSIKPKSPNQKIYWDYLRDANNRYLACTGIAGSGKSLLAAYYSATQLDLGRYDKLYLTRSIVGTKANNLGYLAGGLREKMEPWIGSCLQHLEQFLTKDIEYYLSCGKIEYLPLYTVRGLSADNAIIWATEAQNLDLDTIKCLMTRVGEHSKLILEGDEAQSDLHTSNNDFLRFCEHFRGQLDSFNWVEMGDEDVFRCGDIPQIIKLFKNM